MTHRDVFMRLSDRNVRRSDAGHRKPRGTRTESRVKTQFRLPTKPFGARRKTLPMRRIACGLSSTRRSL